jgi:RimJ/RimL family protein N-acetyltransferase
VRGAAELVTTERLALRRPRPEDLAFVFEVHTDPNAPHYTPPGPHRSLDDSRAVLEAWMTHWNAHGFGPWLVEAAGQSIGFAGLRWRGSHEVPGLNLYFRLRPSAWGHGYATEVARASVRFGFEEVKAEEVSALIHPDNRPSIRVVERIGMTRAATVDYRGFQVLLYITRAIG